jgi:hypothetical protein
MRKNFGRGIIKKLGSLKKIGVTQKLCLKGLSFDVSFTPGFSPVMNHNKTREPF